MKYLTRKVVCAVLIGLGGIVACSETTGPAKSGVAKLVPATLASLTFGNPENLPPGGATVDVTGNPLRAGGQTISYSEINMSLFSYLLWATDSRTAIALALDGAISEPGETMTFASTSEDLAAGKLIWTGQSHIVRSVYGTADFQTRLTVLPTDNFSPLPVLAAADYPQLNIAASIGGFAILGGPAFQANILFEASSDGVTWIPVADLFDQLSGADPTQIIAHFSGAFYYSRLGPSLFASSSSHDYGTVIIGSGAQTTFTVRNNGTESATFSSLVAGANATDFQFISSSCGNFVLPDQSCDISVSFAPTAVGPRSAQLTISGNAPSISFDLTGAGELGVAALDFSPSGLSYGNVNVGTPVTLQLAVRNTGTAPFVPSAFKIDGANPSDFLITINPCANGIAVGSTCNLNVQYTPTAIGSRSATLTISGNAPTITIPLTGGGLAVAAVANAFPTSFVFPTVDVGQSSFPTSFQVTNTGNADLEITAVQLAGANPGDFTASAECTAGPIHPADFCVVGVTFAPTAAGPRSASVKIVSNAAPVSVSLSGTGNALVPIMSLSATALNFGPTIVSGSQSVSLSIANNGNGNLVINSAAVTGAPDFDHLSGSCSTPNAIVAPHTVCQLEVTFKPTIAGTRTGVLTVTTNAGSPTIGLTGEGIAQTFKLDFSATSVAFPQTPIGSSSYANILATSSGNSPVVVSAVTITGANASDFTINNQGCTSGPLAPSAGCAVAIAFSPTGQSTRSALLNLVTNGGTFTVGLVGFGFGQAIISVPQTSFSFETMQLGSTSRAQNISINNVGNLPLQVTTTQMGGANPGDFTIAGSTCGAPVSPGGSCALSVTFSPQSGGLRQANLTIVSNGGSIPVTFAGQALFPADLAVGMSAAPITGKAGKPLTYTIGVQNQGQGDAYDVVISDVLPASTTFASIAAPAGVSCTTPAAGTVGTVICRSSVMYTGSAISLNVTVNLLSGGKASISNTATASTSSADLVSANNSATLATTVSGRK